MKKILTVVTASLFLFSMSSCLVAKKKFDAEVARANKLQAEKENCEDNLKKANALIDELKAQISKLKNDLQEQLDANQSLTERNRKLQQMKSESDAVCERVKQQLEEMGKASASEKEKMNRELADKSKDLIAQKEELERKMAEMEALRKKLDEREARVQELESLIARKDSAVQALKKKLTDALLGFNNSELQVYEKDGKVYVALSDKLLFSTGSFTVDVRGKEALKKVAEVLNKQTDIGIEVEGHTDNKPYMSGTNSPISSNWDLSVMRASSVAKILVNETSVDAKRVGATGRGEFYPIAPNDTPEGRAKNRRIDIVLTPDMKSIFDILNAGN